MGQVLVNQSPVFRQVLLECDKVLATLDDPPQWSILDELCKPEGSSNVYLTAYSQVLCTALQLGVVAVWNSWGLLPNTVIGHSSGEIAAAYAAGYISLSDAIIVAYYRGLSLSTATRHTSPTNSKGAMCAVGLGEERAAEIVESFRSRIQLAAVNSPNSCTLSGDEDAIDEIVLSLEKQKVFCRKLRVDTGQ